MLILLVVTVICLIIRSQHLHHHDDEGDDISVGQSGGGLDLHARENFLLPPSVVTGSPPISWPDVSILKDFRFDVIAYDDI